MRWNIALQRFANSAARRLRALLGLRRRDPAAEKRRLEKLLRRHGMPGRLAVRVASEYFNPPEDE